MNLKQQLLKTLIREEVKKQLRSQRLNESKNDMKDWKVGMWVQYEMPNGKMHQSQLRKEIEPGIWIPELYDDRIDASLPQNELWSQLQFPSTLSRQNLAISGPTRNLKQAGELYAEIVNTIKTMKTMMANDPNFRYSTGDIGEALRDLIYRSDSIRVTGMEEYKGYKDRLAKIGWSADTWNDGNRTMLTLPGGIKARLIS